MRRESVALVIAMSSVKFLFKLCDCAIDRPVEKEMQKEKNRTVKNSIASWTTKGVYGPLTWDLYMYPLVAIAPAITFS